MAYGPGESRFVEEKRHKEKPIPVSDLVLLDRERCILCDRCTRFAKEVAGDPLIHFMNRGNETEVNTFPDEPFSSYFSGNTVQICPVGALTATAVPVPGPALGPRAGRVDLPGLLGRLPGLGRVIAQPGAALPGRRHRSGQLGLAVRQGPLRLRGAAQRRPPDRAAGPRRRRATSPPAGPTRAGPGRRRHRATSPAAGWPSSAGPGSPTRRPTPGPSWPRASSAPTTSTPSSATACRRGGARAAAGHHRRGVRRGRHGRAARPRPQGGAARPLPAAARRGRVPRRQGHRGRAPEPAGSRRYATVSLHPRPGRGRRRWLRALLDGPPPGTDAGGVDANALATASELVAAGPDHGRDRPSVAGRVRASGGRCRRRAARPASPTPASCPCCVGPTSAAPSTWVWRPACCPAGSASTPAAIAGTPACWAKRPRRPGPRLHRHPRRPPPTAPVDVLVLLGADPLSDFPDHDLAAPGAGRRRHPGRPIDQFPTASVASADVVLPAAGFAEVDGTTTNLEGRVSVRARQGDAAGHRPGRLDHRRSSWPPPSAPIWGSSRSTPSGPRSPPWRPRLRRGSPPR